MQRLACFAAGQRVLLGSIVQLDLKEFVLPELFRRACWFVYLRKSGVFHAFCWHPRYGKRFDSGASLHGVAQKTNVPNRNPTNPIWTRQMAGSAPTPDRCW